MCAIAHLFADFDAHCGDDAGVGRFDDVLHLHCLQDHQGLVLRDVVAFGYRNLDDAAWHWGGEASRGAAVSLTSHVVDVEWGRPLQAIAAALPFDETPVGVVAHGQQLSVDA